MKIIICGSGLLGVTAAYVLATRGHQVTIVERNSVASAETSFANGGQLSYSHGEPWATSAVLKKLPKWLLKEDSPLIFRPRADLDMIKWGLRFFTNCKKKSSDVNCINLLRLGLYSRQKMAEIIDLSKVQFDYTEKGILHIYSTQKDFDAAIVQARFQEKFGCPQDILDHAKVLQTEPQLAQTRRSIVGGIYAHLDASGDANLFCLQLIEHMVAQMGVVFQVNTTTRKLHTVDSKITGIETDAGMLQADAYVMAHGSYSPLLLRQIGIHLPIYPMKGYSVTVAADAHSPTTSITDGSHKIVYSRLGDRIRVAGTAEFAGYDQSIKESRVKPILRAAKELFPAMQWDNILHQWACLRPSTPDGPPYLGRTPYSNLYLNTGHGTLGWTQAAGSAYIIADLIENRQPEILLSGLTMERRCV